MEHIIKAQKNFFKSGVTKPYDFRKTQLLTLQAMLYKYEQQLYDVLSLDLNKSKHEALTSEIGMIHTEINFALKHLRKWMTKDIVDTPLSHKGTTNYMMYEPYGQTLIIAPWNYPLQLSLVPVIGAIAAGNTVVLKPSELTVHTSRLLKEMVTNTFDEAYFAVFEGDKVITQQLIDQNFDYIFFTGSTNVGKLIMQQASKHLTPVTLELGGKSPAIVDEDCKLALTAKRIVWGKLINAGQTCVAPDYVYVHEAIKAKFIAQVKKQIKKLYSKKPLKNDKYVRIINEDHFNRLTELIDEDKVVYGGKIDSKTLKIEPTILDNVVWDDPIMQEEIFGPLLPILSFTDLDDVLSVINDNDKPLALYYFGNDKNKQDYVLEQTSSGGACINDTLYHLVNPHLPFGGVGHSGIGAYHGKFSFETFSHRKSVLKQTTKFDIPVRYPTSKLPHRITKMILK